MYIYIGQKSARLPYPKEVRKGIPDHTTVWEFKHEDGGTLVYWKGGGLMRRVRIEKDRTWSHF